MTYDEARDAAQLHELDDAIDEFVWQSKHHVRPTGDRQTLVLFPGGAGSQLKRSPSQYAAHQFPPPSQYRCVWLNCDTFCWAAPKLQMKRGEGGGWVEDDDYIVIAGGSVELFGYTPYDEFAEWCKRRGIDLFLYGYDWRRPIDEVCDFFVSTFVPHFQKRVRAECGFDPLDNLSLIGHSQGGLLVNWLLRHHDGVLNTRRSITVATPFYGYAGQIGRWFAGEPLLNHLGRSTMVRVVSSFPALYALNFLDEATYAAHQDELAHDSFPRPCYPSVDAKSGANADPYLPKEEDGKVRYPRQTGFDERSLAEGHLVAGVLSSPLEPALSAKFFNVRGVLPKDATAGRLAWRWIKPGFDPESDRNPISLVSKEPGDGTQPAWTARLLRTRPDEQENVVDVKSRDAIHAFMMNSVSVLRELAHILGVPAEVSGETARRPTPPDIASSQTAQGFVRDLIERFNVTADNNVDVTASQIQLYLQGKRYTPRQLVPIARRILIELTAPVSSSRSAESVRGARRGVSKTRL